MRKTAKCHRIGVLTTPEFEEEEESSTTATAKPSITKPVCLELEEAIFSGRYPVCICDGSLRLRLAAS
jgi:hypothetical protein